MLQPKNEIEGLLLSIFKNYETLIEQTHRKPEEKIESKMTKPRETFHFKPPVEVKEDWMIGLIDFEVYISIFNITEENNKFELDFLMKNLVVFHMKKSETRLKKTWIFRELQLVIYKMIS